MRGPTSALRDRLGLTLWQRRAVVVWNGASELRVEPDWLAYHLVRFGYKVVYVKVADGPHPFEGSAGANLSAGFLGPLRRAGLVLAGWGYCYGFDPAAEARTAAQLVRELGLHAYVADCEREFEYDPRDEPTRLAGVARYGRSRAWLAAWVELARGVPLGLSSFGRVDLHRLDWAAWAAAGARFLPQAYANESAELAPHLCARAGEVYFERARIHPWLGCYEGAAGRLVPGTYLDSLRAARTRGFALYLADTASLAELRGLGAG